MLFSVKGFKLSKFSVVELFCGCGGFSYGFEWTGKFTTIAGVDIKKEALNTFRYNHPNALTINKDVNELDIDTFIEQLKTKSNEIDVLIGGPPCQGFSQMRRGQTDEKNTKLKGYDKFANDPRNSLIMRFLDIANKLNPKVIVIENVKQVKNHVLNGESGGFIRVIEDTLGSKGYEIDYAILNSADYGVPQTRERMFVIASRIGKVTLPDRTHSRFASNKEKIWVTVKEAIEDLKSPILSSDKKSNEYITSSDLNIENNYLNMVRDTNGEKIFNHQTRTYKPEIINIIKEMKPGKNWEEMASQKREEYEKLLSDVSEEQRHNEYQRLVKDGVINPVFYKDYYWSAYTRLDPFQPALTITANASFLGSGRYTHPYENRGITPREAARLQSFPDSFKFITHEDDISKTNRLSIALDMIGEAVAPLLSKQIAKKVLEALEKNYEK